MIPRAILPLAALVGYVSLSQEILWFRLLSYADGGAARTFAHMLGAFLLGLAFGSLAAKRLADRGRLQSAGMLGGALLGAAGLFYFAIPLVSHAYALHVAWGSLGGYLAVALVAFSGGLVFPALCHAATSRGGEVGASLSRVYFANVVGSILGPLCTTFLLMDLLSLAELVRVVSLLSVAAALAVAFLLPSSGRQRAALGGGALALAGVMLAGHGALYGGLLERLHWKHEAAAVGPYRHLAETRSGIVAVSHVEGEDIIYGGGIYDGKFSVDPVDDVNGIFRAYALAVLHASPRRVLEVGLSSGSWSRVIADHEGVERLDVVEINPGYLDVVRLYPDQAAVLEHPRVHIHIDDARRWLARNPDARFDLMVMNHTFYWRSMATSLMSEEFLRLSKSRLAEGGVVYFNSTGLPDSAYTAAQVFRHVVSVGSFIAASDAPFKLPMEARRENLLRFVREGRPVFDPSDDARRAVLDRLATRELDDLGDALRAAPNLWRITDDNMAPEYKVGFRWVDPGRGWGRIFRSRESAGANLPESFGALPGGASSR